MNDIIKNLADEACEPAAADAAPMPLNDALALVRLLHESWSISSTGHLERVFLLKTFKEAFALAEKLAKISEQANYFPDLYIAQGILRVEIWSRAVNGLSRADFVLAAKLDQSGAQDV